MDREQFILLIEKQRPFSIRHRIDLQIEQVKLQLDLIGIARCCGHIASAGDRVAQRKVEFDPLVKDVDRPQLHRSTAAFRPASKRLFCRSAIVLGQREGGKEGQENKKEDVFRSKKLHGPNLPFLLKIRIQR